MPSHTRETLCGDSVAQRKGEDRQRQHLGRGLCFMLLGREQRRGHVHGGDREALQRGERFTHVLIKSILSQRAMVCTTVGSRPNLVSRISPARLLLRRRRSAPVPAQCQPAAGRGVWTIRPCKNSTGCCCRPQQAAAAAMLALAAGCLCNSDKHSPALVGRGRSARLTADVVTRARP